jgi:preprotein translocase subunit SecY
MGASNTVDWLTLLFGVVLGIPVTFIIHILANLFHPRLVAFLDSRRIAKIRRSKTQALSAYTRIKAFHDGTRDRYPFYIMLSSASVISAIAASTCIVIIFTLKPDDPTYLIILAIFFALLMFLWLAVVQGTEHATEHFDEYRKQVERQWGPLEGKIARAKATEKRKTV